jgi:hypothetical protein
MVAIGYICLGVGLVRIEEALGASYRMAFTI